jgi:hypothetical protein
MAELPRTPLRSVADLIARAPYIPDDRCQWMGDDSPRPCTCGVPTALQKLAADGDGAGQNEGTTRATAGRSRAA